MNYPLRAGIISYLREKNTDALEYALGSVIFNMPNQVRNKAMNLLGSHDTVRILTALAGQLPFNRSNAELLAERLTPEEYKIGKRRLLAAYTVILALPGIPTVFYGDEVGMEGYSDPFCRRSFPWGKEDLEILSYYQKSGRIRIENELLSSGAFYLLHLDKKMLVFERKKGRERIVVALNNSTTDNKIRFSETVTELYSEKGGYEFCLKAETTYLFKSCFGCEIEFGC